MYFSPINSFTDEQVTPDETLAFRRVFQNVAEITGRPPSNLVQLKKFLTMQDKTELPVTRYCGLGTDHFYVIDPQRDIYQCYEDAGHAETRIGSFADGAVKMLPVKKSYAKRHLLNLPECLRCSMALFCGGGCPAEARNTAGSIFKPCCHQNKEFIAQTLRAFFLKQARESAASPVDSKVSVHPSTRARKRKEKK